MGKLGKADNSRSRITVLVGSCPSVGGIGRFSTDVCPSSEL